MYASAWMAASSVSGSIRAASDLARNRRQGTVDQHPRRPFGPAKHLTDLARAHLLHETKEQRLAPLRGQLVDVLPRPVQLLSLECLGCDVNPGREIERQLDR
jgi:hypothetical protein